MCAHFEGVVDPTRFRQYFNAVAPAAAAEGTSSVSLRISAIVDARLRLVAAARIWQAGGGNVPITGIRPSFGVITQSTDFGNVWSLIACSKQISRAQILYWPPQLRTLICLHAGYYLNIIIIKANEGSALNETLQETKDSFDGV